MAREITGVRDYLQRLNEEFPDKEQLSKKDIYTFFGMSRNTLKKHFPELWKSQYTPKTDLAKIMARKSVFV